MLERDNGPQRIIEVPRSPELWRPSFGALILSGPPGSGTTSTAKRIAAACGISESLFRAGDAVREERNNTLRAPGYIVRDKDVDRRIDSKVTEMVKGATLSNPTIAEAQIGTATAMRTLRELKEQGVYVAAPIVRMLLWAEQEERYRRLYEAALGNGEDVTLDEIRENTIRRERGDLAHWREIYPWIGDQSPLEKGGTRDRDGNLVNIIEYDNTYKTAEETFQEVMFTLQTMGYVQPLDRSLLAPHTI